MIHLAGARVPNLALRAICGEPLPPEAEPNAYFGAGAPCPRCAVEFMRYDYERAMHGALMGPAAARGGTARILKRE